MFQEFIRLPDELRMALEMADTTFPVTIKDGNTKKNYTVNVNVQWNVAQVKKEIVRVSKSKLLPNQFQLVFAGTQLKDDMILQEVGVQNTSTLHCVHAANIEIQPSTPSTPILQDLTLSFAEPTSPVGKTRQKNQFYVYCKAPCNGMRRGKIRVRCAECKATSFILAQGPCNWKDVLTPQCIHGNCNNGSCKGDVAEFYFKCAMHQTLNEDTSVPLHMIRTNNVGVECITCANETELVVVFECVVGHSMCIACFVTYIRDALNHRNFKKHPQYGYTIQCPDGCADSEVKEIHHFRIIGEKGYERYHRFGAEECLLQMGGIFCPSVDCGFGMIPEPGQQRIECAECKFVFCSQCRNAYHTGNCVTAEVQQVPQEENHYCFNRNAEHASWVVASKRYVRQISKACPQCGAAIDKTDGCNHMTCSSCKFEFCWLCLTKWSRDCQDRHWFL